MRRHKCWDQWDLNYSIHHHYWLASSGKCIRLRPFLEIDAGCRNKKNCADVALQSKVDLLWAKCPAHRFILPSISIYWQSLIFSLCLTVTWLGRASHLKVGSTQGSKYLIQQHEGKVSHTDPLLKLRAGVDWNLKSWGSQHNRSAITQTSAFIQSREVSLTLDALGPGLGGGDGLEVKVNIINLKLIASMLIIISFDCNENF